jgi:twitching motility protein PilT
LASGDGAGALQLRDRSTHDRGTPRAMATAMATVDSLLKIIGARGADALTIAAGEVPVLQRGGQPTPLSMPPLDAALVAQFADEVIAEELRAALDASGALETAYRTGDDEQFSVKAIKRATGIRLSFRPIAAPPARRLEVVPAAASDRAEPTPRATGPESKDLLAALQRVDDERGTDLILSTGCPGRMRVGGELIELDDATCTEPELLAFLGDAVTDEAMRALDATGSVDLALDFRASGGLRYRVNLFRQRRGLAAALRPIRRDPPTLRDLGLPRELYQLTEYRHGLVLMTGQAGSGKSTTLVALTEHVNRTRARHVITIEDPIEYEYTPQHALIHQREVGVEVVSFAAGLRAALRESPDIIVLGEMRDLDTISAALTAAETGHLVLATLHCAHTAAAIDRIIDVFPGAQQRQVRTQLAAVLRAVITQRLLPSTHPTRPLVPAIEKLVVNDAVAAMIREDKCHQIESQIQTGRADGMISLDRSLAELVRNRFVSMETVRAVAADPERVRTLARSG